MAILSVIVIGVVLVIGPVLLAAFWRRASADALEDPGAASGASAYGQALPPEGALFPADAGVPLEEGLAALRAYARAVLGFERLKRDVLRGNLGGPAAAIARGDAVLAVRRAYAGMERIYGRPGEPDVYWPVPLAASPEALARVELQCDALLSRLWRTRNDGATPHVAAPDAPSRAAWLAAPLASIALQGRDDVPIERSRDGASTAEPDALVAYRRAFEGTDDWASGRGEAAGADGAGAAGAAGAADPDPRDSPGGGEPWAHSRRLEFVRWLVRTGRLSDGAEQSGPAESSTLG